MHSGTLHKSKQHDYDLLLELSKGLGGISALAPPLLDCDLISFSSHVDGGNILEKVDESSTWRVDYTHYRTH